VLFCLLSTCPSCLWLNSPRPIATRVFVRTPIDFTFVLYQALFLRSTLVFTEGRCVPLTLYLGLGSITHPHSKMHPSRRAHRMYVTEIRTDHRSRKLRKGTRTARPSDSGNAAKCQKDRLPQSLTSPPEFLPRGPRTQAPTQHSTTTDVHARSWFSKLLNFILFKKKPTPPSHPPWRAEGNYYARGRAARRRPTVISPVRERSPGRCTVRDICSHSEVIRRQQPAVHIRTVESPVQPVRAPRAPKRPPRPPRASSPEEPRAGRRISPSRWVGQSNRTPQAKQPRIIDCEPRAERAHVLHSSFTTRTSHRPASTLRPASTIPAPSRPSQRANIETRRPRMVQEGYIGIQTSSKRVLHDTHMRETHKVRIIEPFRPTSRR
jgi:hypothetical protein